MVGMGKAKMEEGDKDMGKSQTVEGSIGGEEYGRAAKKEKKMKIRPDLLNQKPKSGG